jgi:hypothetical protein
MAFYSSICKLACSLTPNLRKQSSEILFVGPLLASSNRLMSVSKALRVGLDAFCFKQFEAAHIGPRIPLSTAEFLSKVNDDLLVGAEMVEGYAPFCKHVFVPAFFKCPVSSMRISDSLLPLIRSK